MGEKLQGALKKKTKNRERKQWDEGAAAGCKQWLWPELAADWTLMI